MKKQQGFTLIELMIVVAIIGVLSAIAIPAYKNYVTKSEVASAMSTMKALITPFEAHLQEKGNTAAPLLADIGTNENANPLGVLSTPATIAEATGPELKFVFGESSSIDESIVTFTKGVTAGDVWTCKHNVKDVEIKGCKGPDA
ncbi:pilin [Photobacterium iliopiscarium]|uniref:pilin n=1 Tax=Photobacterium iliopiscarium TaxID=56192 RepID=UPI000D159214|nr:prepilin-type N-terminal cleavage/methylation domain-containing protein [Photobacterium iliopiscarium]PST98715.1 pilus assembly protein PilA [Photobacterium iliopiscarium]PSV81623.1 pilus assembly protein PilA [Photobacterium iliopiscarium]